MPIMNSPHELSATGSIILRSFCVIPGRINIRHWYTTNGLPISIPLKIAACTEINRYSPGIYCRNCIPCAGFCKISIILAVCTTHVVSMEITIHTDHSILCRSSSKWSKRGIFMLCSMDSAKV